MATSSGHRRRAAAILGVPLFGRGVMPAQYCPCGHNIQTLRNHWLRRRDTSVKANRRSSSRFLVTKRPAGDFYTKVTQVISSTLHRYLRAGIASLTYVLFMFLYYLFFYFNFCRATVFQPCRTCHMLFVLLARCVVCVLANKWWWKDK